MRPGNSFPFVRELNELRRGRGLDAADLHQRIGPCLREACGITGADQPVPAREKLVLRLTELCGRLPDDLRLAALAAFGLHEEAAGSSSTGGSRGWPASWTATRAPRAAGSTSRSAGSTSCSARPRPKGTGTRWPAGTSSR